MFKGRKRMAIYLGGALLLLFAWWRITLGLESSRLDPSLLEGLTDGIVEEILDIDIPGVRRPYNTGIVKWKSGYLIAFRFDYPPNFSIEHLKKDISPYIGVVELDTQFKPTKKHFLLNTRPCNPDTVSRAEDPRLVIVDERVFMFYNDSLDGTKYGPRTMHMAELLQEGERFFLGPICKMTPPHTYRRTEKNWMPFSHKETLHAVYSVSPHVVFELDKETGDVVQMYESNCSLPWCHGELRGGTQAIRVGDDYLAFVHSLVPTIPTWLKKKSIGYYFMGAYLFDGKPPFRIKKVTKTPLNHPEFYTSRNSRNIVYPTGIIDGEDKLYVVYNENDSKIRVAVINKAKLLESMVEVDERAK